MRKTIVMAAALAVALVGRGAPLLADDTGSGARQGSEARGETDEGPRQVDAGQIAKNPEKHYGTEVRVKAEVEDVYGQHAFTLDEDMAFAGPDVLVIVPSPLRPAPEDEDVVVTGKVRKFMKTQIERDYEWFDPDDFGDPDLLVRFESRPVIIAESVRTEDGQEIVSSRPPSGGGTRHGDAPATRQHGDMPEGR